MQNEPDKTKDALIFIVDDTPENIDLLRKILEQEGYRIAAATSGERALGIIPKLMPDLILLDVMMPNIDGHETCRRLKAIEAIKAIPVIFITAKNALEDVVTGFELGSIDYIPKPFHAQEVCARVNAHIQIQKLNKEREIMLRKQRRQALHLQTILENISDCIITLDHSGNIETVNRAGGILFGAAPTNLTGRPMTELLSEYSHDKGASFVPNTLTGQELIGRRVNGETFPMELSLGQAEHNFIIVARDITLRKQVEQELKQLSDTDPLTGIPNRRHLDRSMEQEIKRARRNQHPISFLLLDVDFFKKYNDHYGHSAGDQALIQVAEVLSSSIARPADLAARYGGEEFAVLLPDTDQNSAMLIADRILSSIQGRAIEHEKSEVAQTLSVSIGLYSVTPTIETEAEHIIQRADCALYESKNNGRNRVTPISEE